MINTTKQLIKKSETKNLKAREQIKKRILENASDMFQVKRNLEMTLAINVDRYDYLV